MDSKLLIRPPQPPCGDGWRELYRYDLATGEFVPDDGTRSVAFVGLTSDGWPYSVTRNSATVEEYARAANSYGASRYRCCNGRRVDGNGRYV